MGYTIWPDGVGGEVVEAIYKERQRQEELRRSGKFLWTCAAPEISYAKKLSVLAEEFGELSREVVEHGITEDKYRQEALVMPDHREQHFRKAMREELIQIAAVAAAWAESLK